MKPFSRGDRVSSKIKIFLSEILKKKIKDRRLEFATITEVKMSPDLRNAYIYFCIYGDSTKKKEAEEGFKSAAGFLKTKLAKELKLRFVPNLRFYYDTVIDYGSHMSNVLKNI
jgi:ribosome-binding factor A